MTIFKNFNVQKNASNKDVYADKVRQYQDRFPEIKDLIAPDSVASDI